MWQGGEGGGREGDILAKAIHCSLSSVLESPDPSPPAAVPSHRARAQLVTLCSRKLKNKKQKTKPPGPKIGCRVEAGQGCAKDCMHLHTQASP